MVLVKFVSGVNMRVQLSDSLALMIFTTFSPFFFYTVLTLGALEVLS